MLASSPESAVHVKSNDHLRRIPQVQVRDRINDLLPDVRQCTLKELEIFGRGFNPRTSSVVISAYHRGTTIYRTMLVNNLSEEMRARFLKELAWVLDCSVEEIEGIGLLCYNKRRGFYPNQTVPALPLQIANTPENYVRALGNEAWNKWIYIGE